MSSQYTQEVDPSDAKNPFEKILRKKPVDRSPTDVQLIENKVEVINHCCAG